MTTMRTLVKSVASRLAPRATTAVLSARARAHSQRLVRTWGLDELNARLVQAFGNSVISGPFTGLRLPQMAREEHLGPYLLGTYELELHPWWNDILNLEFEQIIDVGAKFGYYAAGLARRYPRARVHAIDPDWWARAALREMLEVNALSNVALHRYCDPGWLRAHLTKGALIVSDCEGYEHRLLCDMVIPALDSATMIIELHESLSPGVTADIVRQFSDTHAVQRVASRTATSVPDLPPHPLSDDQIQRACAEIRPEQAWLLLRPRM